jgi:hypothetical protein
MMSRISAVGVVIGSTLIATAAFAQAAPDARPPNGPRLAFGAPGQIAISSDFSAQIGSHAEVAPNGQNPPTRTTIALSPAVDVFVMQNFSVGGQLSLYWSTSGGAKNTGIGFGPRVGYDVPITDTISFWPKGGLAFSAWSDRTVSGSRITAQVYAPFLLHPAPHFFVGLGPYFGVDLLSRWDGNAANRNIDFALNTTVGGWF